MNRWWGIAGELILLGVGAFAIFFLTFRAPVSYARSDSLYGLTVSVALLEQGTIRLDDYQDRTVPPIPESDYRFWQGNGHLYYAFPLGTPVFATPAVAVAQWLGRDMLVVDEQIRITNGLAALSAGLIFLLLYALARLYLRPWSAYPLALLFVAGTSLISSLGAALWSHHGAVVAALLVLILLAAADRKVIARVPGVVVGLLLFLAYFFRPAQAPFVALVIVYLAYGAFRHRRWRAFLGAAGTSGFLFLLFILFSQREFGTWFPFYYSPGRADDFVQAGLLRPLYGLLFSPGRGLFIFSPMLLVIPLATIRFRSQIRSRPLLWLVIAWLPLQLLLLSRAVVWWGGWSFGPRLLSDVLPGMLFWAVLVWHDVRPRITSVQKRSWELIFGIGALASVLIHAGVGLHTVEVQLWNGAIPPNIDEYPEYLLDWRYPQFLASRSLTCARNSVHVERRLLEEPVANMEPGVFISMDDAGAAHYEGWSWITSPQRLRWLQCPTAYIHFAAPSRVEQDRYALTLRGKSIGTGRIQVGMNGTLLDTWPLTDQDVEAVTLSIPAGLLIADGLNRVSFQMMMDDDGSGFALSSWRLDPVDE